MAYLPPAGDMSESREYTILFKCTEKMKLAPSSSSSLLHSLFMKGLINRALYDDLSEPRSMLSRRDKVNMLVRAIQNAVELNPKKYHVLMDILSQNKREYGDILDILKEYGKISAPQPNNVPLNSVGKLSYCGIEHMGYCMA